ncbi:hypothetical protein KUTeg_012802 [Tegillarca granosa]|uniref:Uncharacterized protein n=1 Tax=Tegillarca granosa TaxID=220873 RepID=A0ABQ9F221_TEGGR|nr:hypothetical protein KUTeg_012802 [Tegillarca granosa]
MATGNKLVKRETDNEIEGFLQNVSPIKTSKKIISISTVPFRQDGQNVNTFAFAAADKSPVKLKDISLTPSQREANSSDVIVKKHSTMEIKKNVDFPYKIRETPTSTMTTVANCLEMPAYNKTYYASYSTYVVPCSLPLCYISHFETVSRTNINAHYSDVTTLLPNPETTDHNVFNVSAILNTQPSSELDTEPTVTFEMSTISLPNITAKYTTGKLTIIIGRYNNKTNTNNDLKYLAVLIVPILAIGISVVIINQKKRKGKRSNLFELNNSEFTYNISDDEVTEYSRKEGRDKEIYL